jgi:membrane associated rhomboid family serine protease
VDDSNGVGRGSWRTRWLSVAIAAACIVLFLVTLGVCAARSDRPGGVLVESFLGLDSCSSTLEDVGALSMGRVWLDHEWWRLGSHALLHGSWLHLAFNLWSLWVVGVWAEAAWGRWRTFGLFVVSAVVGGLASMAWAGAPMVVGASAGVLGIAGGLLLGRLVGRGRTAEILRPISPIVLGTALVLTFALGLVFPVIAQAGHVGGFLAGVAAAWSAMQRGWMRWAIAAVFVFGVVELVEIAKKPDARARYHVFVGFRHIERDEPVEALAAFERALAIDPGDAPLANEVAYRLALEGEQLARADELADVAVAGDPQNANYLDTKGWVLCRRGDAEGGMEWLRKADAASTSAIPEIREHLETCVSAAVTGADVPRGTSAGG